MFFVNRSVTSFSSADSISRPNQDSQATNHPPDHKADSIAEDFGTWMAFELGLVVEIWHFWVKKGVVPGSEEFTLHPLLLNNIIYIYNALYCQAHLITHT